MRRWRLLMRRFHVSGVGDVEARNMIYYRKVMALVPLPRSSLSIREELSLIKAGLPATEICSWQVYTL